jgi:hypothetical protein
MTDHPPLRDRLESAAHWHDNKSFLEAGWHKQDAAAIREAIAELDRLSADVARLEGECCVLRAAVEQLEDPQVVSSSGLFMTKHSPRPVPNEEEEKYGR